MSDEPRQVLTLSEAAAATGLTTVALRRRADRGSLRTVKRERAGQLVRCVPRSELIRTGLLEGAGTDELLEVEELRAEIDRLSGELTAMRQLTERATSAAVAEADQARTVLVQERAEHRADVDALRGELDELRDTIATAGPIKAMRLRRRLRQGAAV